MARTHVKITRLRLRVTDAAKKVELAAATCRAHRIKILQQRIKILNRAIEAL